MEEHVDGSVRNLVVVVVVVFVMVVVAVVVVVGLQEHDLVLEVATYVATWVPSANQFINGAKKCVEKCIK